MSQMILPGWAIPALAAMKRDPKKTGAFIVLVALLTLMCLRTFGPGTRRPLAAAGATPSNVVRDKPGKKDPARQPMRTLAASARLQSWAEAPAAPITRNLFAIRFEFFPVERPKTTARVNEQAEQGFWAKLEKSLTLQADQRDKRENLIAFYKTEAAKLKLQSTMMGPQPKAMVNGELVGEGDVVASFRVVKIEARRIIIEREGIRLEIQMK